MKTYYLKKYERSVSLELMSLSGIQAVDVWLN